MLNNTKPVFTVFGATGEQGGSVINALLRDGTYTIRATTRNLQSLGALALIKKGIEVVQCDLSDKASVLAAVRGSDVVFGVTSFWDVDGGIGEEEVKEGKNLVDACKEEGVGFFVWSSLPNATEISGGKYTHVTHFDNKHLIHSYIHSLALPSISIAAGWYVEDLLKFKVLQRNPQNPSHYSVVIPRYSPASTADAVWIGRDFGPSVVAIAKNGRGRKDLWWTLQPVLTEKVTYVEIAGRVGRALGVECGFIAPETSGSQEFDKMYAYQSEFGYFGRPEPEMPNPVIKELGYTPPGSMDEYFEKDLKAALGL
ncbi:NmrA-like domain-containing protein 1 [Rhizophlyctis rosea]|uniref:NmrA-like domain-containing protein 1 n=1 Tax=Rhizophlyctis rosea TaxID=64517 RepID=A0AAD5SCR2_9FUNG|nr:NmrA-like domain-containing protein 1 [Rhizophlyctis rosea]